MWVLVITLLTTCSKLFAVICLSLALLGFIDGRPHSFSVLRTYDEGLQYRIELDSGQKIRIVKVDSRVLPVDFSYRKSMSCELFIERGIMWFFDHPEEKPYRFEIV